jgi:cell division protein ZapA
MMDENTTGGTATMEQEKNAAEVTVAQSVGVEIYDQIYHLRGVYTAHIESLAGMVDAKMRAVSAHGGTVDSLRVAVLAALNIADELSVLRQRYRELVESTQTNDAMRSRAGSLNGMLDELLEAPVSGRRAG